MTRRTPWLHRLLFTLAVAPWSLVGCAMEKGGPVSDFGSTGDGDSEPPLSSGDGDGEDAVIEGGGESSSGSTQGGGQAGLLTAGAWDDNRNYEHFAAYRKALADAQLSGMLDFSTAEHEAAHQEFAG